MNRLWGILIALLATAIAVIPQFTNCQFEGRTLSLTNGNSVPMKCFWTARAELVAGLTLLITGVMLSSSNRKESRRNLSILGMVLSVFVVLIPTALIGVCQSQMTCNTFMRPSMLLLGSLTFLVSAIGFLTAQMSKDKSLWA